MEHPTDTAKMKEVEPVPGDVADAASNSDRR
jgi:hypothetical protein